MAPVAGGVAGSTFKDRPTTTGRGRHARRPPKSRSGGSVAARSLPKGHRGRQGPRGRPWHLLTVGFAALAVDERFVLHEQLRDGVLAPRGISVLSLPWIAPWRLLGHAHRRDRTGRAPRAVGRPHRTPALPAGRGTRGRALMAQRDRPAAANHARSAGPPGVPARTCCSGRGAVARAREAEAATGDASGSTGGFTFSCDTAPPTARDDR